MAYIKEGQVQEYGSSYFFINLTGRKVTYHFHGQ